METWFDDVDIQELGNEEQQPQFEFPPLSLKYILNFQPSNQQPTEKEEVPEIPPSESEPPACFYGIPSPTESQNVIARSTAAVPTISDEVSKYTEENTAKGTLNANRTAMNMFLGFCISLIKQDHDKHVWFVGYVEEFEARSQNFKDKYQAQVHLLTRIICLEEHPSQAFTTQQEARVAYFVTAFVVKFEHSKLRTKDGSFKKGNGDVTPGTLRGYLFGIQRIIRDSLGVSDFQILKVHKIKVVANNCAKEMQRLGYCTESHNTLLIDDFERIFESLNKVAHTSSGYRNRLVFAVGLSAGFRPGEMYGLTLENVFARRQRGVSCIVFKSTVGGINGESKTKKGGLAAIGRKHRDFLVADEWLLNGKVNFYKIIKEYLDFRSRCGYPTQSFFLGVRKVKHWERPCPEKFFTRQNMGVNLIRNIVRNVCATIGVTGDGVRNVVTGHSLRATMVTMLLEAKVPSETITLRTGQKNVESLRHYQNLLGAIGIGQMRAMYGGANQNSMLQNGGDRVRLREASDRDSRDSKRAALSLQAKRRISRAKDPSARVLMPRSAGDSLGTVKQVDISRANLVKVWNQSEQLSDRSCAVHWEKREAEAPQSHFSTRTGAVQDNNVAHDGAFLLESDATKVIDRNHLGYDTDTTGSLLCTEHSARQMDSAGEAHALAHSRQTYGAGEAHAFAHKRQTYGAGEAHALSSSRQIDGAGNLHALLRSGQTGAAGKAHVILHAQRVGGAGEKHAHGHAQAGGERVTGTQNGSVCLGAAGALAQECEGQRMAEKDDDNVAGGFTAVASSGGAVHVHVLHHHHHYRNE